MYEIMHIERAKGGTNQTAELLEAPYHTTEEKKYKWEDLRCNSQLEQ